MDVLGIDSGAPAALVVQLLIGGCLIAKLMGEYLVMHRINAVARQFKRAEYNIFTYWRDFFRGVWDMRAMLAERYQASPDTPFVIPSMYFGPLILIPPSLDPEFRSALDSQLSATVVQFKLIQPWHTLPDPTWGIKPTSPYRAGFNKVLNRSIGAEVSTTAAELAQLCDDVFGVYGSASGRSCSSEKSGGWKEVKIHEALMTVATMNVSRLYVGKELAQNKEYIRLLLRLLQAIVTCIWLVNLFPEVTKPLLRQLVCLPIWIRKRTLEKTYLNKLLSEKKRLVESDKKVDYGDDFTASVAATAAKIPDKRFSEVANMSSRVLLQHFPAIHTTGTMSFCLIEKLLAYPALADRLRREAQDAFKDPDRPETWAADELSKLKYHDCFIAETLRTEPLIYSTVRRSCVKKGGFTFSDGTYIPEGFDVGIATDQVHKDPRFWKDPLSFNPDRWLERDQVLPYNGSDFMAFGTGRHLCSGRFFASQAMRIILAYINVHYKIEAIPGQGQWHIGFGLMHGPLEKRVRVRKRERKDVLGPAVEFRLIDKEVTK